MKNWGYLLFSWLPQEWRPNIEIGYLKLLRFAQMLQAHHRIIHRIRKLKICMNLNLTRSNTFMILFKLISFPLIKEPWIFAKGMNRNGFWKLEHEWLSLFLRFDPNSQVMKTFIFPQQGIKLGQLKSHSHSPIKWVPKVESKLICCFKMLVSVTQRLYFQFSVPCPGKGRN